ncbi:Calmodulin-binding-like protein [Rhynchospora pubera]|uniref:Calmodulin-binding-like protein n=1 Tax=Rhynchospora pubera TaxID=906938 RepID=A0AAV8F478_9POAL|nr:Calmodulin-binding-like protein [Rhynchospora pubera]
MKRKCCLTVTGEISPTTRRWRRFRISWSFLSTSRQRHRLVVEITDSCFLNELRRRLQSRGESSRRLFLEQVIDALTSSSASASASGTGRAVLQELPHLTSPPRLLQDHQNIPARYRLRFINRVKNPSFTTDPVKDEEGNPIRVQLYDNCTKVSPDCFLPSDKVKISVIDSNGTVLSARKGKRPILTGYDLNVHLKNGVGTFKNIFFNDNSSWSELQLRVTVESEAGEGFFEGERVEEDVSAPFVVKDRKSKAFQKPDKLELTHEVEKLKKIGKGVRASRLKNKGINTVEKFLDLYFRDQSQLCKILDIKSDHNNWNVMVQHAMECVDEFHAKNLA